MKRRFVIALPFLLAVSAVSALAQIRILDTNHYDTASQMLLANEINESGEPYAEALGYDLDLLDPMLPGLPDGTAYALGIENYEYSRYQLGVVIARSGLGLHMMWSPLIIAGAAMETDPGFDGSHTGGTANGYREDDELMKAVMHFGHLAGQMPPQNAWPQFGEFVAGDPHYAQPVDAGAFAQDFSTLRWDRSLMTKQLSPGAMGQALMKQYLWAQDMLSGFHDAAGEGVVPDGSVSPDGPDGLFDPDNGVFFGGDGIDGFVGQVLTAESINKIKNLLDNLAYDGHTLGSVNPMTYDPADGLRYFPHRIAVEEEPVPGLPPRVSGYQVVDASSDLFDQASLLWGTVHFADMMNPGDVSDEAHVAYRSVFDGDPFPASMSETGQPGPYDLMMGASRVVFLNLMAMHWDADAGTFRDLAKPSHAGGQEDHGKDRRVGRGERRRHDNQISTVAAAYVLVALDAFQNRFAGTPLAATARAAMADQAEYLMASLRGPRDLYRDRARVSSHGAPRNGSPSLSAQAAAVRGLYAASSALDDGRYREAADAAYAALVSHYYRSDAGAFQSSLGHRRAEYDPELVAVLSGALREARLVGGHADATDLYVEFWNTVVNKMQLAEGPQTGETGGDSDGDGIPFIPEQIDGLAPVFAPRAVYRLGTLGHGRSDKAAAGGAGIPGVRLANSPNPFNPLTVISFTLPRSAHVGLAVFDVRGREVQRLVNGDLPSGDHAVTFRGDSLASGIYHYVLDVDGERQTGEMTLVK